MKYVAVCAGKKLCDSFEALTMFSVCGGGLFICLFLEGFAVLVFFSKMLRLVVQR